MYIVIIPHIHNKRISEILKSIRYISLYSILELIDGLITLNYIHIHYIVVEYFVFLTKLYNTIV